MPHCKICSIASACLTSTTQGLLQLAIPQDTQRVFIYSTFSHSPISRGSVEQKWRRKDRASLLYFTTRISQTDQQAIETKKFQTGDAADQVPYRCRPYFAISLNPVSSIPTRFTSVAGQFTTPPTRPTTSVHGTAKLGARLQISTPCKQGVLPPSRTKPWFRASSSHKEVRPCPLYSYLK